MQDQLSITATCAHWGMKDGVSRQSTDEITDLETNKKVVTQVVFLAD